MKLNKKNNGFTLIELLIGVIIIGVLIAIGSPYYNKYIQSSKVNSSLTSLSFYKTSIIVCLQTKTNHRVCNGGEHNIPQNFSDNSIRGIQSIKTKMSVINVVSEVFLPDINKHIKIQYKPISKKSVFEWEISCNDYNIGTIVENCFKTISRNKIKKKVSAFFFIYLTVFIFVIFFYKKK